MGCVVAEKFAAVEARIDPAAAGARARVHFRAEGGPYWYYVEMKPAGDHLVGVLPRPKKGLKRINYYLEVIDASFVSSRTEEYAPEVVLDAALCRVGAGVAAVVGATPILVGAPAGAPAVPLGFSGTVAGTAAAAAGAGAAGAGGGAGGGIGTAALIAGGVAVAGSAVAIATRASDEPLTLQGEVHAGVCACFERPGESNFPLGPPIGGAVVSTSLDSRTATTDAAGRFTLVTATPWVHGATFTLTIDAAGCRTFSVAHIWGRDLVIFTLACP